MHTTSRRCSSAQSPWPEETPALNWEVERAKKLHRQFLWIEKAKSKAMPFKKSLRRFARNANGQPYASSPSIKQRFAFGTLNTEFNRWRYGGKSPRVFRLHYPCRYPANQRLDQATLLEFLAFCSAPRSLSLLAAWNEFVQARYGPAPVSYSTAGRYFSSAQFRAMQRALREIRAAQTSAGKVAARIALRIQDRQAFIAQTRYPAAPWEMLLAFVKFCSVTRSKSLHASWRNFCETAATPPPIGYAAARRYFSAAQHRRIQAELERAGAAEQKFRQLYAQAEQRINARFHPGGQP